MSWWWFVIGAWAVTLVYIGVDIATLGRLSNWLTTRRWER